jgi:hypothetical protein
MAGACNVNVKCPEGKDWNNEIRSVAMMMTNFGQGYCTGAMVNNQRQDGRQLFLTANHCVGRDVQYDAVLFNHESNSCDERTPGSPVKQSAQGLKKLSNWAQSDFALFEVQEAIPAAYKVTPRLNQD